MLVKYTVSITITEIDKLLLMAAAPTFLLSEGLINLLMLFPYSLMTYFTVICFQRVKPLQTSTTQHDFPKRPLVSLHAGAQSQVGVWTLTASNQGCVGNSN